MKKIITSLAIIGGLILGLILLRNNLVLSINSKNNMVLVGFASQDYPLYIRVFEKKQLEKIQEMRDYLITMFESDRTTSPEEVDHLKQMIANNPVLTVGIVLGMQSSLLSYLNTKSPTDREKIVENVNYMSQHFVPELRDMIFPHKD